MKRRGRRPRTKVDGPIISLRPPRYVVRWHRVDDWAYTNVAARGDVESTDNPNTRIAGWRASWVRDMRNEEEAYDEGTPVETFGDLVDGPSREVGGSRRASVRLFTWTVNAGRQGAYEPQWITTGWGMSARAAAHAHGRWIDNYADAVSRGVESRRLIATAIEVVFWTAGPTTDYV
jgi:hypothetical protein